MQQSLRRQPLREHRSIGPRHDDKGHTRASLTAEWIIYFCRSTHSPRWPGPRSEVQATKAIGVLENDQTTATQAGSTLPTIFYPKTQQLIDQRRAGKNILWNDPGCMEFDYDETNLVTRSIGPMIMCWRRFLHLKCHQLRHPWKERSLGEIQGKLCHNRLFHPPGTPFLRGMFDSFQR